MSTLAIMRIYTTAIGCKLNQNEMESLARQIHALGHEIVGDPALADISILNTCTVTHIASRKSRQALRQLRRANPDVYLVVTGCYAEVAPEELGDLGIALLVDNATKENLVSTLSASIPGFELGASVPTAPFAAVASRTRAFIKIQDGCDNACTYCIVTKARGPARSRPRAEIMADVRERLAEGYQELVLTGVHIGCYGQDRDETLADLVEAILAETDAPRLRLSSIEPWDMTADLLDVWRNPRLCRHLHLPLQSGCDSTLARMGRKYDVQQFSGIVQLVRWRIPDAAVTTDIIVGFPGETDAEFEASRRFVAGQGFARVHVFRYSRRPGTLAAQFPAQVSPQAKEARSIAMRQVSSFAAERFLQRFLGRRLPVLWETQEGQAEAQGQSLWSGLTDNYIRVFAESAEPLRNVIRAATLLRLAPGGVWAEIEPVPELGKAP